MNGYNLRQAGYEVYVAHDGQDRITQAQLKQPDVVILELMLPVVHGLDVCKRLRDDPTTRDQQIIMLTEKDDESDQLVGFSLGADDYVTKPFSVKVLMERIKALRRRHGIPAEPDEVISRQGITADRRAFRVSVLDQPIQLTRSEFRLLDTLNRRPGRVFQRSELMVAALGHDALVLERTIDVHVRALRRKLGDHSHAIKKVRGVGYRFHDIGSPPGDSPD